MTIAKLNKLLIKSAINGNLEEVRSLVERGADIHAENDYALKSSAVNGHLDVVKYLVERGANIHVQDDDALRRSASNGHVEIVKYLVERGANIHAENDDALKSSAVNGHLDVVKYLVERGANIHADHDEALGSSAEKGHLDIVKYLVEGGADIHAQDDKALRFSAYNGHLEVVKYLVESGADIHALDDEALRYNAEKGHLEIVKYLVESGADIHAKDDYALRWSAWNGHLDVVKYLVEMGADIHAKDDMALRYSAEYGILEVVKYLIESGADIHAQDDYALRRSAEKGHLNVVKYLVERGANIHAQDDYALRRSTYEGHLEIVKYLVEQQFLLQNLNTAKLFKNYKSTCNSTLLNDRQLQLINTYFNQTFSKDNICEKLYTLFNKQEQVKQLMLPKCHNDQTILLTDLKDVPGIYFYNTEINGKLFCGDIRELGQINTNKDPWTNQDFTQELNKIKQEVNKYQSIIEDLEDDSDIVQETMTSTIRRAVLKILERLRYPKDVELFVNATNKTINEFINKLYDSHIISSNDKNNLLQIGDLNGKKLAIANLLKLKIENDNTIVTINGASISSLLVELEELYNSSFF